MPRATDTLENRICQMVIKIEVVKNALTKLLWRGSTRREYRMHVFREPSLSAVLVEMERNCPSSKRTLFFRRITTHMNINDA